MPHKFKIGAVVTYYPKDRRANAPRGACTVMGHMPGIEGELEYRIKHFDEEFERVALENELSASEPQHGQ
jgi:hypothetical protein